MILYYDNQGVFTFASTRPSLL